MMKSKFAKAAILGMCITILSATTTLAAVSGGGQSSASQGQQTDVMITDTGSRGSIEPSPALSEPILKKQSEIDKYLFEEHKEELAKKDIVVTHTAPNEKYIEIGITPYNEENAEYLYKIFGKDMVTVVEGKQAITMTGAPDEPTTSGDPNASVSSPVMDKTAADNQQGDILLYTQDGIEAELYATTGMAEDTVKTTSNTNTSLVITLVAAGAIVILGGTTMVLRKRKLASR